MKQTFFIGILVVVPLLFITGGIIYLVWHAFTALYDDWLENKDLEDIREFVAERRRQERTDSTTGEPAITPVESGSDFPADDDTTDPNQVGESEAALADESLDDVTGGQEPIEESHGDDREQDNRGHHPETSDHDDHEATSPSDDDEGYQDPDDIQHESIGLNRAEDTTVETAGNDTEYNSDESPTDGYAIQQDIEDVNAEDVSSNGVLAEGTVQEPEAEVVDQTETDALPSELPPTGDSDSGDAAL